jgi:hypothetical protein
MVVYVFFSHGGSYLNLDICLVRVLVLHQRVLFKGSCSRRCWLDHIVFTFSQNHFYESEDDSRGRTRHENIIEGYKDIETDFT